MRWLFVGVIALNVLYFGWNLAAPADTASLTAAGAEPREFPSSLELLPEAGAVASSAPVIEGCPAVGPWASREEAGVVVTSLAAAGIAATIQRQDLKGALVFWVHLPPLVDRAQAARKLRELQSRGMDSFVVASGPDANAISLGSFTARDSALGVQARLRAAGYPAEIREQRRDVQQTWVVLKDPAAQGYLEFLPADLRDRARQQRLACAGR